MKQTPRCRLSPWQALAGAGRRRLTWFVLVGVVCLGCGRAEAPSESRGSEIIVAYSEREIFEVDPWYDTEKFLVFLPLMGKNERGEPEGRLASAWEHSPDYRETTYHLRTGVRWHDGTPVTARDVEFTLELQTTPGPFAQLGPGVIESVTVVDDSTVAVRAGTKDWEDDWTVILPAHLLESKDPETMVDWEFWRQPVGNGPYRFVRYVPRTLMELEANPDYYRGKPRIERVVLRFVEGASPLTELLSGNVDAMQGGSLAELRTLAADSRFAVYRGFDRAVAHAIYWQTDHPILGDARVRRALTLAMDRRGLLRLLDLPGDAPLVDGPYTARQMRRGDLPEPLPYDPEAARRLLETAGWVDEDGDGVRERNGTVLRFTAIGNSRHYERAIYIQEQLRGIGAQMEIQLMDSMAAGARRSGGDFEAFLGGYASPNLWFRPPTAYFQRLAGLLDTAAAERHPDVRDRAYEELTKRFREDNPVTFLYPQVWTWVAHRRIRGLSSGWMPKPDVFIQMEELWIEEE